MKPAAFVWDGTVDLEKLKSLGAKVFAASKVIDRLENAGIQCQRLDDPVGIDRIFGFGHRKIHLFGFDLSNPEEDGTRLCFESRVFWTTPELASHAQLLVRACMEMTQKGADITVHGDGMFPHMARCVMRDLQEKVLTAVYDMHVSPPTYEIFSFLSQAEKYRQENGYTCIDVVFAPGPMHGFRDDGLPPNPEERSAMLHRICISGSRLLPSVRNTYVMKKRTHLEGDVFPPDWTNDRPTFCYGPRFQKDGFQCLEATEAARAEIASRFKQPYTTITLREADYWPKRNSNKVAWEKAARWLQFEGFPAVVVPDTHGTGLHGCEEFQAAAWDIDLRLALYEGATLNLGVQNGPMALLMFAKSSPLYIVFQKPDEDSPGTQEKFMSSHGINPGDNWTVNGWTVWEDDSPENVMQSLRKHFPAKEVLMA